MHTDSTTSNAATTCPVATMRRWHLARSRALAALPDQTLQLLNDGYLFQTRLRRARGRDAGDARPLRMRLLGRPATLVRGAEGVGLFYDADRMRRAGAMPLPIRGSLFGAGAVHGLDGRAHETRKAMLVRVAYDDAQVQRFADLLEPELTRLRDEWGRAPGSVYDGAVRAYGRAALTWAGVPGDEAELDRRSRQLAQVVEGFGRLGPAHALAWINRWRTDAWTADLVRRVRDGGLEAAEGTSLAELAAFRDERGEPLDARTAGVDLQNTFRPTIAVARFAAFAARELALHPDWRARIHAETAERGTLLGGPLATAFAHEVRRTAPFVPMLPAFARRPLDWRGAHVGEGERVLLDVLGTNTDPEAWPAAATFDPSRFEGASHAEIEAMPAFVPQGGGDVHTGHRCPGEKITVTALAATIALLADPALRIERRGLSFSWKRMPTMPRSGGRVRATA